MQDLCVLLEQCNLLMKNIFRCNVYAVIFYSLLSLLMACICLVRDRKKLVSASFLTAIHN